jgi:hypothetical protein
MPYGPTKMEATGIQYNTITTTTNTITTTINKK